MVGCLCLGCLLIIIVWFDCVTLFLVSFIYSDLVVICGLDDFVGVVLCGLVLLVSLV